MLNSRYRCRPWAGLQLRQEGREARMKISPPSEYQVRSFSEKPGIHYLLTICFIALIFSVLIGNSAYDCFVRSAPHACGYPEELGAPGLQTSLTFDFPKMQLALLIASPIFVLLFLVFLILCLPSYSLAFYIGKRCNIQRNVVGVIFWIVVD
jgi:hypothetical protein